MFLIKLDGEKEDFYLCSSSDWTTVVIAENKNEAANKALTYIIDELGLGANVAAVIRVKKSTKKLKFLMNCLEWMKCYLTLVCIKNHKR